MNKRGRKPYSAQEKQAIQQERNYQNYLKMYSKRKQKFGANLTAPLSKKSYLMAVEDYRDAGATRPNVAILKDQLSKNQLEARIQRKNLKKHIKDWKKRPDDSLSEVEKTLIKLYDAAAAEGSVDFYKQNEATSKLIEYIDENESWKLAYGS